MAEDRKKLILANVRGLAGSLLRSQSSWRSSIEKAIEAKEITVDEIVHHFKQALREGLGEDLDE